MLMTMLPVTTLKHINVENQFINWKMQLKEEENADALSRMYIVRIFFISLRFLYRSKGKTLSNEIVALTAA